MAQKDTAKNTKAAPASALPLFYKAPVPLDAKAHAALGLKKDFNFGFAKEINAVPVNLIEMPQVCHFYPIAFSPDDNAAPVAILGLRDNENLALNADNTWETGAYIPAYIRRYPFIFSETPGNSQLTLCVDLNKEAVQEGGAQAFFKPDGSPSDLTQNALEFCKSYHGAAQTTLEFSKALAKSGLLVERNAQINLAGNHRIQFSGFKVVDEQKLAEMDDKTFMEWRKKGYLPFLYAHLFSGAQWQRLSLLLNARLMKEAA